MKEIIQSQNFNNHNLETVFHDADSRNIVIFCHGFRNTNVGPNRFFVRAARKLAEKNISSLRFDQYGSGNSEGDFFKSSFKDWIETARAIAQYYIKQNFKVALFGQSMGGSVVIAVVSEMPEIISTVAWVPDPNVEGFNFPESGAIEENGQIVRASFWQEACDAKIAEKLPLVKSPAFIVQCTADEHVDQKNRDAISKNAGPNHVVENFEGLKHSAWAYQQSEEIIEKSVEFLVRYFK